MTRPAALTQMMLALALTATIVWTPFLVDTKSGLLSHMGSESSWYYVSKKTCEAGLEETRKSLGEASGFDIICLGVHYPSRDLSPPAPLRPRP